MRIIQYMINSPLRTLLQTLFGTRLKALKHKDVRIQTSKDFTRSIVVLRRLLRRLFLCLFCLFDNRLISLFKLFLTNDEVFEDIQMYAI